jgi:hypothetical protein
MSAPVVRSWSDRQEEILASIVRLHCPDGFDADLTFGNGSFYRGGIAPPRHRFDIDPQVDGVVQADSRMVPLPPESVGSAVFDPPFLTYVRAGRDGNGRMLMARRFAGYWTSDELEDHYRDTISEAHRILRKNGVLVIKCQDIVHNHRLLCTHANVILWAEIEGFRLKDLFVLAANHRLPSPNRRGQQKHARVFHSFFLVFVKGVADRMRRGSIAADSEGRAA